MKKMVTEFCTELLNKSFDEYDELKNNLNFAKKSEYDSLFELAELVEAREEYISELENKIKEKEEFYTEFLKQIIGRR